MAPSVGILIVLVCVCITIPGIRADYKSPPTPPPTPSKCYSDDECNYACENCVFGSCLACDTIPCHTCDHHTGKCTSDCKEHETCDESYTGTCKPRCPDPCDEWDSYSHQCVSRCAECEKCETHYGKFKKCRDKCSRQQECKRCNSQTGQCESQCDGCSECDGYGHCIPKCDVCERCSDNRTQCEPLCPEPCSECHFEYDEYNEYDAHGRDKANATCRSTIDEGACEVCGEDGKPVDRCSEMEGCFHCDGYGQCVEGCRDERCEICHYGECVSRCDKPCERCRRTYYHSEETAMDFIVPQDDKEEASLSSDEGYGHSFQCVVDDSLRNPCGTCPEEDGFGACSTFFEDVAFKHSVFVCDTEDLCRFITETRCEFDRVWRHMNNSFCSDKNDCDDCDSCTRDMCNENVCEHEPLTGQAADRARCGKCSDFAAQFPHGGAPCDDRNPCTFDRCNSQDQCVHLEKPMCVGKKRRKRYRDSH